jgi:hypothetical protein
MATLAIGAAPYLPPTDRSNQAGTAEDIRDPATLAADAAKQAAAVAEAGGLTDVQLRELAGSLQSLNAGLTSLSDENGATAISLPTVETPTDMGALSTADLLQIIRAEVAKTTALLTSATIQAIKDQKEGIEARRAENTTKIQESIDAAAKAAEKAEKSKALNLALKIFGGIAIAIMLVMGAVTGGATAVIAVAMLAMFVTMTCMTEIKNKDGETGMDLFGKSCAKTFYSHLSPEEAEKKGSEFASYFMMAVQAVVAIACIAGALGAAASALSQVPAMASKATAAALGPIAAKAGAVVQIAQGATAISAGVVALQTAELQYDADMAGAEVTKLKALIKMLETMLQGDTEFIQMLMELQAKLDAGVAEIVGAEAASNEATDLNNPVTG